MRKREGRGGGGDKGEGFRKHQSGDEKVEDL